MGPVYVERVHEVSVVGVRLQLPESQPIVLLKEVNGERFLPIWIGPVEATAIAVAQTGMTAPRPLTHDLLRDVLAALDARLQAIQITELRDAVYYADLVFATGLRVSARPSDAIALAMRTGTTIFADESVLAEAGIAIPDEQENEVEKFREFLNTISPEDFQTES